MAPSSKGYRFPAEIIAHCVLLRHRFTPSLREVEELMLARGVAASYETIRQRCAKSGPAWARELRRRWPRAGDKRHLDILVREAAELTWAGIGRRIACDGG